VEQLLRNEEGQSTQIAEARLQIADVIAAVPEI
jgi:hypothetical protein